jgi:asparagine synthase (glutamine-hydrolysing)
LKTSLVRAGHRFTSASDTEVLVHGYEEWGIGGLAARLNGMFAFALWDSRRRELHLVRDRLGKKPLYYGSIAGRLVFASELKALWSAYRPLKVRLDSVARFLYWSYLPGRETIYEDVYQLLPGHILTISETGRREDCYWRPSFARKRNAPVAALIDQTDAILTEAVRRRLRSDVPLGAFLSGGVDSSYVVSRMAATEGEQVRTFAIGTSDAAHDERSSARDVASLCGTTHTDFEINEDIWHLLPRMVWEFGQPFADPACIPTYYVAKYARQHVTVALTGDGGDESFGGYSHHQGHYLADVLRPLVPSSSIPWLVESGGVWADGGSSHLASAARFVRYMHPDPLVAWGGADRWALRHLPRLWSRSYRDVASRELLLSYALEVDSDFDGDSAADRILHHDLRFLLPFCFNVKVDVATMMSSLEARCPFQDREVVEWAAQLPVDVKMRPWQRKALLKRVAARWLPREVIYRPKHGFSLPIDAWFRGAWARPAEHVIFSAQAMDRGYFDYAYLKKLWDAHAAGTANHGARFFSLLWLELWLRTFIDQTLSVDADGLSDGALHNLALG